MSRRTRGRLISALIVTLLVGLAGCGGGGALGDYDPTEERPSPAGTDPGAGPDDTEEADEAAGVDGELELHHIDVGQGDATLIITPRGETILVDTGPPDPDGRVVEYLESHDVGRIDHLVATHPHHDHIGGHPAVIEWAETEGDGIGTAYDPALPHTSSEYERYREAIEAHDIELVALQAGDELPIVDDRVSASVINPPEGAAGEDLHNYSLSIVFEFGEFRYVTTGDANATAEVRMVDRWAATLDADVYQAGHHGGASSSSERFLDAIRPSIVVISSNYGSEPWLPSEDILERFASRDIETYWTGVHGDIVVTMDGSAISVVTSEDFSTDPADLAREKPSEDAGESMPAPLRPPYLTAPTALA